MDLLQRRIFWLQSIVPLHFHLRVSHPEIHQCRSFGTGRHYIGEIHSRWNYGSRFDPNVQEPWSPPCVDNLRGDILRLYPSTLHTLPPCTRTRKGGAKDSRDGPNVREDTFILIASKARRISSLEAHMGVKTNDAGGGSSHRDESRGCSGDVEW
jgi:hypothetical protein